MKHGCGWHLLPTPALHPDSFNLLLSTTPFLNVPDMVRKTMDGRQQDTRSPQHPYSAPAMDPTLLERLVRETVSTLNLQSAAASARAAAPSGASYAPPVDWEVYSACADCAKLTALQRQDAFRKRTSVGILPATGCRFCGLASKPESFTKPFCDFLTENPTIFHAVGYFKDKLDDGGFTEVGMGMLA